MTELREQIYSIVNAVSAVADNVFYDTAQETGEGSDTTYPYLVFTFLTSPRQRKDTGSNERIAKIQFDLYGESGLDTIADELESDLDDTANYSFTEYSIMNMFEDFRVGPFQIERDASSPLWQLSFQYTYSLIEV